MARMTLLDIVKANGSDAAVGLIDETAKYHPELTMGEARTIKGINYKTLVRTALPTSGFRGANEGVTATKGTYENRLVETFILNPRWEADKAVADAFEDGAQAYIAMEAEAQMEASLQTLCKQFYYGPTNGGDAKGFPGLLDAYDTTNMVVDAGGTTASTGSSAWLVSFGSKSVQWVWGNNGQLMLPDVRIETIYDTSASKNPLTGYVQDLLARPGLQVGTVRGVCRIKKLTADSGKGMTDALISQALAKFQVGVRPDVIFMSRRSRQQLQASRTVTIFSGGGGKPTPGTELLSPIPDSAFGIPIAVTDAILDTEALTL